MLFLISLAYATPSDLPSGECATEVDTTVQRSGKEPMRLTVQHVIKQTVLERKDFSSCYRHALGGKFAALTEVLLGSLRHHLRK